MPNNIDPQRRMVELVTRIHEANDAYYNRDEPLISDQEYDTLFRELQLLEQQNQLSTSTKEQQS